MTEISGVYQITCTATGARYIGSSVNVHARWASHIYELENERHANVRLTRAHQQHGRAALSFSLLELAAPDGLVDREQWHIDQAHRAGERLMNTRKARRGTFTCTDEEYRAVFDAM